MESGKDEGGRNSRGCGKGDSTSVLRSLGRQLSDALHRLIGQAGDDVDEVGFGIEAGEPAVFNEREQVGQARPGVGLADLQPVLGAGDEWTDRLVDQIIFDPRRGFAESAQQRRFLPEQVTEGFAEAGFRRRHGAAVKASAKSASAVG